MSRGSSLTWMHRDAAIPDLYGEPNCRHVNSIFHRVVYKGCLLYPSSSLLVLQKNTEKGTCLSYVNVSAGLLWQTESLNHTITYLRESSRSSYLLCCVVGNLLSDWFFWSKQRENRWMYLTLAWEGTLYKRHENIKRWLRKSCNNEAWGETTEVEWKKKKKVTVNLKMTTKEYLMVGRQVPLSTDTYPFHPLQLYGWGSWKGESLVSSRDLRKAISYKGMSVLSVRAALPAAL